MNSSLQYVSLMIPFINYKLKYIFGMFHNKVYFIHILWCETLIMGLCIDIAWLYSYILMLFDELRCYNSVTSKLRPLKCRGKESEYRCFSHLVLNALGILLRYSEAIVRRCPVKKMFLPLVK